MGAGSRTTTMTVKGLNDRRVRTLMLVFGATATARYLGVTRKVVLGHASKQSFNLTEKQKKMIEACWENVNVSYADLGLKPREFDNVAASLRLHQYVERVSHLYEGRAEIVL